MVVADASLMCFPYNVYVSFDLDVRYAKCRSLLVPSFSLLLPLRSEMIKRLVEALKGMYATAYVNYVALKAISDCLSVNSKYLRRSAISIASRYQTRSNIRFLFWEKSCRKYIFPKLCFWKKYFRLMLCFFSVHWYIALPMLIVNVFIDREIKVFLFFY